VIDQITMLRAQEVGLPAAESHPDPPLVSYPLRMDWEATQPVVPVDRRWPAPEVTQRLTTDYREKTAVAALVKLAGAHGWTALVTEARGCLPSVGGRPSVPRWNLLVRMSRGVQRAVASYQEAATGDTWTWDGLWWWADGEFPGQEPAITEFMDRMFGPPCKPTMPTDWSCPYFGPVHGPKRAPRAKRS
jgi:hypothetical protein